MRKFIVIGGILYCVVWCCVMLYGVVSCQLDSLTIIMKDYWTMEVQFLSEQTLHTDEGV